MDEAPPNIKGNSRHLKRTAKLIDGATARRHDDAAWNTLDRENRRRAALKTKTKPRVGKVERIGMWPVEQDFDSQTTMLPSALRNAMVLFQLRRIDVARMFDSNQRTVRAWLEGRRTIPAGIAAYFRLRTNEMLRAVAAGVGVGILTDVDNEEQAQWTTTQVQALIDLFNETRERQARKTSAEAAGSSASSSV